MDIKLKSQLRKITTFIFDVDGVLTDATVIALRGGELARVFNVKDGYALGKAIRSGFRIAIIYGREVVVALRFFALQVSKC